MKKTNRKKKNKTGLMGTQDTKFNREINFHPHRKLVLQVPIEINEWETIKPAPVVRKDRTTMNLKPGWTHLIISKLWGFHRIPCPFAFKKHQFPVKKNSPYLKFFGNCHECGNGIDGFIQDEPDARFPIVVTIETHDTSNLEHLTSTHLANGRREKEKQLLGHTKASRYVAEKAVDELNDSGTKPPFYISDAVARTTRQEAKDENMGIRQYSREPVTAIVQLMSDVIGIREFFVDPVIIYYWLDNQTELWNSAADQSLGISIDATGSIVKRLNIVDDVNSSPIFLYNIVLRFANKVYSICQMLSSKHDSITIARWLQAWLESGAKLPPQATSDCSWSLLGAMCTAFNLCGYFEYIEKCHGFLMEQRQLNNKQDSEHDFQITHVVLPCRIMRDRAHLLKSICKWKCFTVGQNWTKKDLYCRAIAFAVEIEVTEELDRVILALLVVCSSEIFDEGSNCFQQYQYLAEKISNFQHLKFEKDDADNTCSNEHCSFLQEFDEQINQDSNQDLNLENSTENVKAYLDQLQDKSTLLLKQDQMENHTKINPYFLPAIKSNLLRLFREYPTWTNVTLRIFPFIHYP